MCGINGFNWKDVNLIRKMNNRIRHRGPDDEGEYIDRNVSLGHVRLSIIDLTEAGHQPMENENGDVKIIFNGEIYNFFDIKKLLERRGHVFNSHTDTEVIIHSYEEWGEKCVERFKGMWAFAIYDRRKKNIFLSRDRFGIKSLYYYIKNNKFIFSSEIKSIFEHDIPQCPNDAIMYDFLVNNLIDHTDETFFYGIKKLMPGHNLTYDLTTNKFKITEYYNLSKHVEKIKNNKPYERFKNLFLVSVKRRLLADVPVGSCLSGGLDSSSIVCAMREIEKNRDIHTFSLVFPGNKVDESRYQKVVIDITKAKWHKTTFKGKDVLNDINDLVYSQEEPFKTLSIYGQYRVMKLARENKIKVLLDGQGSDEILAGYYWFFGYYFYELLAEFRFREFLKNIMKYKKTYGNLKPFIYTLGLLFNRSDNFFVNVKFRHLNTDFLRKFKKERGKNYILKAKSMTDISILAETYFSLPYLLRLEDKNSMRWSIEARVPFCDHEFVEYVCALSSRYKIKDLWTKVILRESLKGLLPEEIRLRKDKVGFATPDDDLLRTGEGKKLAYSIINSDAFRSRKYWNWKNIKTMLERHIRGDRNYGSVLWKIFITEIWLELWIDGGQNT